MRARTRVVGLPLLLVAALTACGEEPTLTAADEAVATPSAAATVAPVAGTGGGPAANPDEEPA